MNSLLSSGLVEAQYEGPKTNYFVNLGMLGKYVNAIRSLSSL